MWEIIKERIKEMKKKIFNGDEDKKKMQRIRKLRSIMLGFISIKYLSKTVLKEYIEEIEADDISDMEKNEREIIWNQIQEIFLNYIHESLLNQIKPEGKKEKNNKLIKYKDGNNFEGIIKYLQDRDGKNLHEKGIIIISASSTHSSAKPEKVIDYNWNDRWCSNGETPGEWWEMNFVNKKVKINGYSIKTYSCVQWNHLKNWVIEGKNVGEEWEEIDRQDNNDLNGASYQHYFSIPKTTKPYQCIRIKNIGKDHFPYGVSYFLVLTNFEIFGEIQLE